MITRYIVVYGYSTPLVAVSQCQSANMIHLTHPIGPSLVHHHVITTAAHPLMAVRWCAVCTWLSQNSTVEPPLPPLPPLVSLVYAYGRLPASGATRDAHPAPGDLRWSVRVRHAENSHGYHHIRCWACCIHIINYSTSIAPPLCFHTFFCPGWRLRMPFVSQITRALGNHGSRCQCGVVRARSLGYHVRK